MHDDDWLTLQQHSIYQHRPESQAYRREPFVQDDQIAELGHSFEAVVFGGSSDAYPAQFKAPCWLKGRYLHQSVKGWPNDWDAPKNPVFLRNGRPALPYGVKTDLFHVPLLWTSALLSEEFWRSTIPKVGSKCFHHPKKIISQMERAVYHPRIYPFRVAASSTNNTDSAILGPEIDRLTDRWKSRQNHWYLLRPWYYKERLKWEMSPWAWALARQKISEFRRAHARRDDDLCARSASELLAYGSPMVAGKDKNPSFYLFHAIGLLMLATLPIHGGPSCIVEAECDRTHYPSITARELPNRPRSVKTRFPGKIRELPGAKQHRNIMDSIAPIKIIKDHRQYLEYFAQLWAFIEKNYKLPRSWVYECIDAWHAISRSRNSKSTGLETFADFPLEIPPYDPTWLQVKKGPSIKLRDVQKFEECAAPSINHWFYVTPRSRSPSPEARAAGAASRRINKSRSEQRRVLYPQHFTISQVADHRTVRDAWVLKKNHEQEIDVFDITGLLAKHNITDEQFGTMIEHDEYGRYLKTGHEYSHYFLPGIDMLEPIGRMLRFVQPEEIAEHDGSHGSSRWLVLGADVYDVTRSFLTSDDEKRLIGIDETWRDVSGAKTVEDLLEALGPYRCALVRPSKGKSRAKSQVFTMRSLRWHDNPDMGFYVAINDIVYDLSGYLEFHPGGRGLLRSYYGRDATTAFSRYHREGLLEEDDYLPLKIGKIVPEMGLDGLEIHHIAIHGLVFNISGLANDNERLYSAIQEYGGTDATDIIRSDSQNLRSSRDDLVELYLDHKSRVVGELVLNERPPEMTLAELRKHSSPDDSRGALVAVGDGIFDVTTMMRYYWHYENQIGSIWAGRVLQDAHLATWLTENYECRCVARLVGKKTPTAEPQRLVDVNHSSGSAKRPHTEENTNETRKRLKHLYG
ncbi:hypothetical protein F4779DRAFT_573835 [Xylariaceae sp. FL0662B]|nr:hypothetical protein F4779DRAFT_573835 [Xylariaceae sp. FL0662B]